MKLLMEQWRVYQEEIKEDSKFNLVLEQIDNSTNEEEINSIISEWINEQEHLLNEFDLKGAAAKASAFLNDKINSFLIKLYFKAISIVSAVFKAGVKYMGPAIKVLKFMGNKLSSFAKRHPMLARVGTIALIAVCMLCASAIANTAMAAGPEGNPQLDVYIDMLQGIMADKMTDIGQFGAQDILGESDPEIKAKLADAINHLETMKGSLTDLGDLKQVEGQVGKTIKTTTDFMVDIYRNPPEGMDKDTARTALENWQEAGEQINQVYYQYSEETLGGTTRASETFKSR